MNHTTWLLPGLCAAHARDWLSIGQIQPNTQHLEYLFSRAELRHSAQRGLEQTLAALLGLTRALPVQASPGYLTPMHMEAGLTDLVARQIPIEQFNPTDTQAFVDALNEHFAEDGYTITPIHDDLWAIDGFGEVWPEISPSQVLGQTVGQYLPQSKQWRAFMNEAQMILFQHPNNDLRAQRGERTVNALWPWSLSVESGKPRSWRGITGAPDWAEAAFVPHEDGAELIVDTRLLQAVSDEDVLAYEESLEHINDQLGVAVAAGQLVEIVLDDGRQFSLPTNHRWRVWKRSRPLMEWLA